MRLFMTIFLAIGTLWAAWQAYTHLGLVIGIIVLVIGGMTILASR